MTNKIKVNKKSYHRNGVSGEGFHVALFSDEEQPDTNFIGIQFSDDDGLIRTAVLDIEKAAKGIIEFGLNSWRGDNYHCELKKSFN